MAKDDFEVIAYKLLAYLYGCLKADSEPNFYNAKELAQCSEMYMCVVVASLLDKGLVMGSFIRDMNGDIIGVDSINITLDGASYLKDNSTMQKVKNYLGNAFIPTLTAAIEITKLI